MTAAFLHHGCASGNSRTILMRSGQPVSYLRHQAREPLPRLRGLLFIMDVTITTARQAPGCLSGPPTPTKPATALFIYSLLGHCALLGAIVLFHSPPTSVPVPVTADPIRARLVFAPPAPAPATATPAKQPQAAKQVQQPGPSADKRPSTENAKAPPTSAVSEPVPGQPSTRLPPITSPANSERQTRSRVSSLDAARHVINKQYQRALAQDAENAAVTRRQLSTQPVLTDSRAESAGLAAQPVKPVLVNCDSNTNQVLTLLSGIAGGNLQCSDRSDFEKFVDKRVTKLPSDR